MSATARPALPPEQLITRCDPASIEASSTAELEPLADDIGQERAVEAVRFGVGIRRDGFNLFAFGPLGTGKHSLVHRYLEEQARSAPVPSDWCYVNNFAEPRRPQALALPPGRARPFAADMQNLVEELQAALRNAFESEDYQARRRAVDEALAERQEEAFNALQEKARARDAALIRTPMGFTFAPTSRGEVVTQEAFRQWPDELQERTRKTLEELEKELQDLMKQIPQWQREHREKVRALNHEVTGFAAEALTGSLRERYRDLPAVVAYLDRVQKDIVEHADAFIAREQPSEGATALPFAAPSQAPGPDLRRYRVNVIVDNGDAEHAPVVTEDHPSYPNLLGRVEYLAQFGALTTDFNLVRSGALHRANGGYLLLEARRVLMQPFAWEELKRALRAREIRIQSPAESLGIAPTISLEPEPIAIDVKVALIGEPTLYYLLSALDPDFAELFKVAADFDDRLERTAGNSRLYARLIATLVRKEGMRDLDAGAIARTIDHAARMAADAERLSLRVRSLTDLLLESDYWAERNRHDRVEAGDVQQAIDAQVRRLDRIRERSLQEIHRGTILIDTEGEVVGRVNGLAVLQTGDFVFGRPTRITARAGLGRGEVVDIEREVELGGPLHSKGVLILAGYLRERFGRSVPLVVSASLVFEQSYGGVDGDSASSTELYALLSALSGIPVKQSLAVTGAVNQQGQVQAIGGVNEKIEGFFDVCAARGLTGEQGVLIPAANVKHLMLREDVVAAAAAGRFHVHAVETVDEGLEILTGVPAGAPGPDGSFPPGTVNHAVQGELRALAERAREFGRTAASGGIDGGSRDE